MGKQVRHKLTVDRRMAEISLCCYARNRNDTVSLVIAEAARAHGEAFG